MKKAPALFFFLLCLSLPCRLYPQGREQRQLFSDAYTLFYQRKFPQAEELFLKTLNDPFPLKDHSLYFLGLISSSRGELETSRNYFTQLKKTFSQSVWSAHADLQLAKLALAEENYPQALRILETLRAQRNKREVSDEAHYLLAQLQETLGEPKQAYLRYQELRRTSPLSSRDVAARKKVNRLREQYPQLFGLNSPEALSEEGELLLKEGEYQEAERIYRRLLDLVPQGNFRALSLSSLANVYLRARKRDEAIPVLAEIVQEHSDSPEAPNALYQLAQIYWSRDDNSKALDLFTQLKERYPRSAKVDSAYFASARIYESLERTPEAVAIYNILPKRFPNSSLREEALWRVAWIYYLQANYDRARRAFKAVAADKAGESYKTAALYWQGRTAEKMGRAEEAKRIFVEVLNSPEDNYYKRPAARRLASMGVTFEEKKNARSSSIAETAPPLSPEQLFHFSRAQELAEISLNHLAVLELDAVKNSGNHDLPLKLALIREYARNQAYARSVALASDIQQSSEEVHRYRYPVVYWETIRKKAAERGIDPYLVLALIRQESLFDPRALSPASAFGLMQLLPSTAARAAKQLGLRPPSQERLYDPQLNLTLGTHHLKELLQRYSNNVVKALAAYNAGEDAVTRWEKQMPTEDEEEFIERITYRETRLYVKLVLRNHAIYRKLYDSQK
jgi:soluble lytic murein transglycosylase